MSDYYDTRPSVGVIKDEKLKLRGLHDSDTLGSSGVCNLSNFI